jgi:hypothetical protein
MMIRIELFSTQRRLIGDKFMLIRLSLPLEAW